MPEERFSVSVRASIIVPAYRCAPELRETLRALKAGMATRADWELIVIDDSSGDDTAAAAAPFADLVLPTRGGPRGPAHARNLGASAARGEILVFVDADVVVGAGIVPSLVATLHCHPTLTAVFGAYDTAPGDPGFVSQYRNLLHHLVHVRNLGLSKTFWTGCSAIRRAEFLSVGGFDDVRFTTSAIEDIDFGYRLTDRNGRILLDPSLQVTHLKRWTLVTMIRADLLRRAVPWMCLLIDRREAMDGSALNVQPRERVLTAVAGVCVVTFAVAAVMLRPLPMLLAVLCALALPLFDLSMLAFFRRTRGWVFALRVIPMRSIFYMVSALGAAWALATHRPPTALTAPGRLRSIDPERRSGARSAESNGHPGHADFPVGSPSPIERRAVIDQTR